MTTYPERFPVGSRVVVKAGPGEGSDEQFNGRHGIVVEWFGYSSANVRFDERVGSWPNPTTITCHNLRHALNHDERVGKA